MWFHCCCGRSGRYSVNNPKDREWVEEEGKTRNARTIAQVPDASSLRMSQDPNTTSEVSPASPRGDRQVSAVSPTSVETVSPPVDVTLLESYCDKEQSSHPDLRGVLIGSDVRNKLKSGQFSPQDIIDS